MAKKENKTSSKEIPVRRDHKKKIEKPDPCVATFEMALAQSRLDGSAIYRITKSDNTMFSIGDVSTGPGFLPQDADFNQSFINILSDNQAVKSKQDGFAKFLKLKVKIEM